MKNPATPFPTSGYFGSSYFCDRKKETQQLLKNFKSGASTTLISIRRLGKTALIRHVQHQLQKKHTTIYLDIHSTENLTDFLNAFATAVTRAVPQKSTFGQKVWQHLQSLRPIMSYDHLTGAPQVSFDIQPKEAERNIAAVLQMLEVHSSRILIAIDEFQQILNYPEKTTDAWFRSIIQQLRNVSFIFSGSRQHLMAELFNHPSRPFYRSTSLLKLEKISTKEYSKFIRAHFAKSGREMPADVVNEVLEWTEGYTYYVQLLCSRIFITGKKKITKEIWHEEAHKLLKEQEPVFYNFRELLTKQQWKLLGAIAKEKKLYKPTQQAFIAKYKLGSSAAVLRSLDSLLDKEMLYFDYDADGEKYYKVYDLLLKKWLE